MKAGRELDAIVAEKVMGWKDVRLYENPDSLLNGKLVGRPDHGSNQIWEIKKYSIDIAEAWRIVERLSKQGVYMRVSNVSGCGKWRCATEGRITDYCETAPMAICLAALNTVGIGFII